MCKNAICSLVLILAVFSCSKDDNMEEKQEIEKGIVKDFEGNEYKTVIIGEQVWMAENLKATKYADGTVIPLVEDNNEWAMLGENNSDRGYCFFNNNAEGEKDEYGALYTYAAAVNGRPYNGEEVIQGVCPDGWHIPSMEEWMQLVEFIDDSEFNGSKLKKRNCWEIIGENETDEFGFCALPSGFRYLYDGKYKGEGREANWWSTVQNTHYDALAVSLYTASTTVQSYKLMGKSYGLSVRCVKNDEN